MLLRPIETVAAWLAALALFAAAPAGLAGELPTEPFFVGMGDLPGSIAFSEACDVSADGSVVVGSSISGNGLEAYRWEAGAMTGLGDLPGPIFQSRATGVSDDGLVVTGIGKNANRVNEGFRWEGGVMDGIGAFTIPGSGGAAGESEAFGISGDGEVIVGRSNFTQGFWWQDDVLTMISDGFDGGTQSFAVNRDGSVVGYFQDHLDNRIRSWRLEDGEKLELTGGAQGALSEPRGMNGDGTVIVGRRFLTAGENPDQEAYRWEGDAMGGLVVGLGDLPGGDFTAQANAVSADGSVVVGFGFDEEGQQAFVWDEANGMRRLIDVAENDFGLDLTGWQLVEARGISDDGLTIVGDGINPESDQEGFLVHLPEPGATALGLTAVAAVAALGGRRKRTEA